MLSAHLLRQLLAAQHLGTSFGGAAAAAAVAGNTLQRYCHVHQRSAHAASKQADGTAVSGKEAGTSSSPLIQQEHQQGWQPTRALPPASIYGVKITIKAHDLIFVKMASTAIRDLVMVNLAPKSRDVLPELWRQDGAGVPWVKLAMPVGDRAVPTRRTHFTVIKGPHVHKTSREQFARTTHTRVIQVATNNLSELNWLLHSIKMYKFVAVELSIRVTSSSYLLPTSTSQQDAAQQPLLASHKQRFAHLFGAAAPSSSSTADITSSSSGSGGYAALQESLQELRSDLHSGLLQQRMRLGTAHMYGRWQETAGGQIAARQAAAAAGGVQKLPGQQLQESVAQQLEGSSLLAAVGKDGSSSSRQIVGGSREQALLAAVDKVLAGVKTDVLDRHKFFPFLMAFYQPSKHQASPAQWMQAVLMYGKQRQQEVEASQPAAVVQSYQQYGQVSRALMLLMLQQWYKSVDGASRQQLMMPDAEEVGAMLDRSS